MDLIQVYVSIRDHNIFVTTQRPLVTTRSTGHIAPWYFGDTLHGRSEGFVLILKKTSG